MASSLPASLSGAIIAAATTWSMPSARDRVRALQLMQQAMAILLLLRSRTAWMWAEFLLAAFTHGLQAMFRAPWKLQALTDLTTLPDYEEGNNNFGYGRGRSLTRGRRGYGGYEHYIEPRRPGAELRTPVFYTIPASWAAARNDGERWRWALQQTALADPERTAQARQTHLRLLPARAIRRADHGC